LAFIIRIYHDARSSECETLKGKKTWLMNEAVLLYWLVKPAAHLKRWVYSISAIMIGRRMLKYSEENLSHVHCKSNMDCAMSSHRNHNMAQETQNSCFTFAVTQLQGGPMKRRYSVFNNYNTSGTVTANRTFQKSKNRDIFENG